MIFSTARLPQVNYEHGNDVFDFNGYFMEILKYKITHHVDSAAKKNRENVGTGATNSAG